jgi:hypothetical protein
MPYVTLIPGLLCIAAILKWGTHRAFLNVVLPALLLLPCNFFLEITHLPHLDFLDVTLLPLGFAMLVMNIPEWRFSLTDLLVLVFVFSCGYSEWTHFGFWRTGALAIIEGLFPYMAGKLLMVQPGMGLRTTRRFIVLLAFSALFAMPEFFFRKNPYDSFWIRFYPGQWGDAETQIRWTFGRMAGPFVQSEFAGMILFTGVLLALWFLRWHGRDRDGRRVSPKLVLVILVLGFLMTLARGPWIGSLLALAIASIGLAQRPARRAAIVVGLLIVVGIPTYEFAQNYSGGPRTDYGSERETAQYRAELIDNYIPLAESGGPWGYGRSIPIVAGQGSIDNEYLFVWLVQGYVGLVSLLLLLLGGSFILIRRGLKTDIAEERHFLFTLLAILLGIAFTVTTVWLGGQSFELLFLLLGWTQAVRSENIYETDLDLREENLSELAGIRIYT